MSLFHFKKKSKDQQPCCCNCQAKGAIRNIKVLGSGCKNCHTLLKNTQAAVKTMGLTTAVEYITDMEKIMEYGAMSMPALVVNDQVVSVGRVLKPEDIQELLNQVEE